MNFTPFSTAVTGAGATATHFVTGGAAHQFAANAATAKFAQNITAANGATLGQVVGVVSAAEGGGAMQYLRTIDGGASLTPATHPQLITLPITMAGAKPGDPQATVQIQVLNPNAMTLQQGVQTPKYQMQIPIQTFQQGAAVLTVAYAQESVDGIQILGNSLPEGLQVVAALQPQDLQLLTAHMPNADMNGKEQQTQTHLQQQAILIPSGQHMMTISQQQPEPEKKVVNNNTHTNNNNMQGLNIKQEHDSEMNIDEDSTEFILPTSPPEASTASTTTWNGSREINEYINKMQKLPVSLQQFLKFNPDTTVKAEPAGAAEAEGTSSPGADIEKVFVVACQTSEGEQPQPKPKKKKKYKKKPPKPQKPKPGQVVIATALDGTTLFCCPECHMAYPEKEQLEFHLVGHKIERRFICGICGAGLKRKEHLERHKLGHNPDRPYVCTVCMKGFKRKEHLNLHIVIHSGEKREVCQECGKGFYRKDHLRKHARSHLSRRAKEELFSTANSKPSAVVTSGASAVTPQANIVVSQNQNAICPEITIHVPTSSMAVPIQISVPHHIVSLANSAQQQTNTISINTQPIIHNTMEELLMQHS